MFGLVANEAHKQSAVEEERAGHKHAATASAVPHFWNKVAKLSLQKYRVPLNAVAHDTYLTMYAYLRNPSKKKPLQELDEEPYLSTFHPRGQELVELLEANQKSKMLLAARGDTQKAGEKRKRDNFYKIIVENQLRTTSAFRTFANKEAAAGRGEMAEFYTRCGHKLEDMLDNAWAIVEAPKEEISLQGCGSLLEKLEKAAVALPCLCGGAWPRGAAHILSRNRIDTMHFCAAVLRALKVGARRGANIACVGAKGCGKSTLIEALDKIFTCAPKPEDKTSFPLGSMVGSEVLLWQDYEHNENTLRFTDLLSWLCGEGVLVRMPGKLSKKICNTAPCFYSGRVPMHLKPSHKHGFEEANEYNDMMGDRFTTYAFWNPLPMEERNMEWIHCGRCCAGFFLQAKNVDVTQVGLVPDERAFAQGPQPAGAMPTLPIHGATSSSSTVGASSATGSQASFVKALSDLSAMYAQGHLDDDEFRVAKRRLLALPA